MTEEELINRILSGESKLYLELVQKYQPLVFRTCMGFVHNKDDADDLTQEVFLKAYQSLAGFKGNSVFSTWLYRIAVNTSLNYIRSISKTSIIERIGIFFSSKSSKYLELQDINFENPEQLLITGENHSIIQKALDSLPEKQRIAIVLSKYDDLSQKEIARVMNTTEGAVEALIQRAKANLREKLKFTVGKK